MVSLGLPRYLRFFCKAVFFKGDIYCYATYNAHTQEKARNNTVSVIKVFSRAGHSITQIVPVPNGSMIQPGHLNLTLSELHDIKNLTKFKGARGILRFA